MAATAKLSLLDKVEGVGAALRSEVVERDIEIHLLLIAVLSGNHLWLLGPPGVAKSYLFDRFILYVQGMRTFKILMNPFTQPNELFGPVDVPAMKQSRERRVVEGYMPWADFAMVDEIWKAGKSCLNTMLGITNERTFRNDGVVGPVPLSTMVCGSNETPESGGGLAAIEDRILLRKEVAVVRETSSFIQMLRTKVDPSPKPIITWDELNQAKAEVAALPINERVYDALAELRAALREGGVDASPRRYNQMMPALQAEAWLDGATEVDRSHISIASHVLWNRPEQQATVERIVLELANPMEKQIIDLMTDIEALSVEIDEALNAGADKFFRGTEVHRKVDEANEEYHKLVDEVGSSRRQQELLDSCRHRLHNVTVRMIGDVFNLPTDDVQI